MTSSRQASATPATAAGPASPLQPAAIAEHLRARLGEAVRDIATAFGQATVTLAPEALAGAARLCRESPELDFDFYNFNAGVDLGEDGFAVVTALYSLRHRHHVLLRVLAPGGREAPRVPSLTSLYLGANWHERETYDMFGIDFEGHPGLLPRLLTVENFEGFPLRKDFLLSTREAKPWPGLKEPKEVGAEEEADAAAAETPVSAEDKAKASQARAERAREKATAMRAQKQAERESAQSASSEEARAAGAATADDESDAQAAAANGTPGGDTGGEAAAQVAAAAGEPEPQTSSGAADIAGTAIAKDAAAGAVGGDTAAGATGDASDSEQPIHDPEAEAAIGEGAPPTPSGTPGVEAEGRHAGTQERDRSGEPEVSSTPLEDDLPPATGDADPDPQPTETLDETSTRRADRPPEPSPEAPDTSDGEGAQP